MRYHTNPTLFYYQKNASLFGGLVLYQRQVNPLLIEPQKDDSAWLTLS